MPAAWILVAGLFVVHALLRFGGLWNPLYIPLSMILIWPLPWLLASPAGRRRMGFRMPKSGRWFVLGPTVALGVLALCAAIAWGFFGSGTANWFVHHARTLQVPLDRLPPGTSVLTQFGVVTLPALLFSPLAEEFLYRGVILTSVSARWGTRVGMGVQAAAFALVHLAHYGLAPVQPLLIAVWVPSMALAALAFGWIVQKSGSVWCAVGAHAAFNAGMNGLVFVLLPGHVGL